MKYIESIDYKDKYYYQINYDIIKKYLNSKYKKDDNEELTEKSSGEFAKYLNKIFINGVYINPDKDKRVLEEWSRMLNSSDKFEFDKQDLIYKNKDKDIKLSLDGQFDWKFLYNLYNDNYIWLEKYNEIRQSIYGQLLWPAHKKPTIDSERYKKFNNRLDFTLFDIKNYFHCAKKSEEQITEVCKLCPAYLNKKTREWLMSFDSFKDFIDTMRLNIFVKQVDGEYQVIDLQESDIEKEEYKYIINYQKSYDITTKYIDNLIELIKDYPLMKIKGRVE